jgi:hypothetical protein
VVNAEALKQARCLIQHEQKRECGAHGSNCFRQATSLAWGFDRWRNPGDVVRPEHVRGPCSRSRLWAPLVEKDRRSGAG